jgi:putative ABC transport system permease protein
MWSDLRIRLRSLFRRRAVEAELDAELAFHLERQVESLVRAGVPPEEAARRARLAFGGIEQVKEECRQARGIGALETAAQDLRYGLRVLRRTPGVTATAVLTLAVGLGANTAIFSVVHTVLLRPLPYPHSERLVVVWGTRPQRQGAPVSATNFLDYQEQSRSCERMATFHAAGFVLTGGEPEWLRAGRVSPDFFAVLGVRAARGRTFAPEDGRAGGDKVVILGPGIWRRRFGADPAMVGKSILLSATRYTVIGVLPPGFDFSVPGTFKPADVWVPAVLTRDESQRGHAGLYWLARLKPGVSLRQAHTDLQAISDRLARAAPQALAGLGVQLVPLREQGARGVRPLLLILLGAVGFLLLIACANVASLQLARASTRQKEVALRLALGAGRRRVMRQLLTESLLLALLGGALGVLLARWGVGLLGGLAPANLPRGSLGGLDTTVLAYSALLAVATGVLFGLAPAFQTSAATLGESLKEGGRAAAESARGGRLRAALMVAEVALALVLLTGAGLLARSFARLLAEKPGFDVDPVLTVFVSLPRYAYPDARAQAAFERRAVARLQALPGVVAAGGIDDLPLTPDRDSSSFLVAGREPALPDRLPEAQIRTVTAGYFRAMGIPVVRGREIAADDVAGAPPVLLINEALARRDFPGEDPVGRRLSLSTSPPSWATVVGVVADVRDLGLEARPEPEIYLSFEQSPLSYVNLVARVEGDPGRLAGPAREALRGLDKGLPLPDAAPMRAVLAASIAQRRFSMLLLGLFALVALALAAVGVYGVISYAVARRTHEISVRMALGARRADVLKLVIGRSLSLTACGVGAGLAGAFLLSSLLANLLYGVAPTDLPTFAGVTLLLSGVAALASYLPARRAMAVDPVVALRNE